MPPKSDDDRPLPKVNVPPKRTTHAQSLSALAAAPKEEQLAYLERLRAISRDAAAMGEAERKATRVRLTAKAQEIRARPDWISDPETLRRTAQDVLDDHKDRKLICPYCREAAQDRQAHHARIREGSPGDMIFSSVAALEKHIVESTAETDGELHEKLKIAGGWYDEVTAAD